MDISDEHGSKIRRGILGTGRIARDFANALIDTPGAVLVAVPLRGLENALVFGREFHVDACFGNYQELADADGIDVIYIVTPNPMHAENSLRV